MENQQRQQDLQDTQAIRNLYAQARQTGQPVTNEQLMAAAPTTAPTLIKANLDAQESLGKIQKAQEDLADAGKEYIAGQAYSIYKSNFDPAVIEHMFQTVPQIYAPQVKQLQSPLSAEPRSIQAAGDGRDRGIAEAARGGGGRGDFGVEDSKLQNGRG
jgi:hypothetical protein